MQRVAGLDVCCSTYGVADLGRIAAAQAEAARGDLDGAIAVAAAKAEVELKSERARDYLRDLASWLAPHAGLPAVQEFMSLLSPAQAC